MSSSDSLSCEVWDGYGRYMNFMLNVVLEYCRNIMLQEYATQTDR